MDSASLDTGAVGASVGGEPGTTLSRVEGFKAPALHEGGHGGEDPDPDSGIQGSQRVTFFPSEGEGRRSRVSDPEAA